MRREEELLFLVGALGNARADEGVEEEVSGAGNDNPVRVDVANGVSNICLDEHHHGAAEYHSHEDTGGDCGVLSESFNGEVEDSAPHN